jgi:hypothetical protein
MMTEPIERKFRFLAVNPAKGTIYTEMDGMVFLAKDQFLPEVLSYYEDLCARRGAGKDQVEGVRLLRKRVVRWQQEHPELLKTPDVDPGREAEIVNAPNQEVV